MSNETLCGKRNIELPDEFSIYEIFTEPLTNDTLCAYSIYTKPLTASPDPFVQTLFGYKFTVYIGSSSDFEIAVLSNKDRGYKYYSG